MSQFSLRTTALALAAPGLLLAMPASAATGTGFHDVGRTPIAETMVFEHGKKKGWKRGRGNPHRYASYGQGYRDYRGYDEPVYRNTRVWRGDDGRYYCRKENGTTGLLIGAAVGGLAGHEIAGRGNDRTLGAILGAAGGALLGRAIDKGSTRCR